ncbi:unnamed protein product, partial [Bubo scandiacus]
ARTSQGQHPHPPGSGPAPTRDSARAHRGQRPQLPGTAPAPPRDRAHTHRGQRPLLQGQCPHPPGDRHRAAPSGGQVAPHLGWGHTCTKRAFPPSAQPQKSRDSAHKSVKRRVLHHRC